MNILTIAGSGIGGTEKAAFLFAEELVIRGYTVTALSDPCPRSEAFVAAGGTLVSGSYTRAFLLKLIVDLRIDVIHQHVSGYGDHTPLYSALDSLGDRRPKLIETNVFGQLLDFNDRNHVDMRMFISFTSGLQAFSRTRVVGGSPIFEKHTVLFYPLHPSEACRSNVDRSSFRESIGVSDEEFLVIRIGRPGHKWTNWECDAFRSARNDNPKLRMLLMEPPPAIAEEIQKGRYGDGIIVREATADSDYLAMVYGSADLMLHASNFGESFGYTLAEGMIAALPVITRATPWGDDAQTELVLEGITGHVCGSVGGMAHALSKLSLDQKLSLKMGGAGKAHIASMSCLEAETDLLEEILSFVVSGQTGEGMRSRYQAWMKFIRCHRPNHTATRYEISHGLRFLHLTGKVYETYRCAKIFKRFFKLRLKGRPVLFPSR